MQLQRMRRFGLILICVLAFVAVSANAGTYKLTDGTQIVGDPISMTDDGVQIKESDGSAPRVTWDKLTPETLKDLYAEAKSPHDRKLLQPIIDDLPGTAAKLKELPINPVTPPERPTRNLGIFAMFSSSVGLVIVLVLYGANLFAAYEVALYRRQPVTTVCGLAAIPFVGVLSPIAFIIMPGKEPPVEVYEAPAAAAAPEVSQPGAAAVAPTEAPRRASSAPARVPISMPGVGAAAEPEAAPATSAFPEPIVFARGDFSFNRRFFETKFPGFFRAIRAEAEKDLVLLFKTSRGDFVGRRITNITPNELYLQVFVNDVTADEMIPFTEVMEVQIRHKDLP
jgi:hypothetical protein